VIASPLRLVSIQSQTNENLTTGIPKDPHLKSRKVVQPLPGSLISFDLSGYMKAIRDILTTKDKAYMNGAF